jgi:hypothetical protein
MTRFRAYPILLNLQISQCLTGNISREYPRWRKPRGDLRLHLAGDGYEDILGKSGGGLGATDFRVIYADARNGVGLQLFDLDNMLAHPLEGR